MQPGQTISHYRIVSHIGGGGMGEVYRAEDRRLQRIIALKFLPDILGRNAAARERFIREARAASALDHPNICTIHDIDETDDHRLFITMACYDGETVRTKLNRGLLPLETVIAIVRQVAEGLAKAHRNGIVHRDLHPSNIHVTEDGVVKILDFGLAKLAGTPGITGEGTTLGTIGYMAPEQVRGDEVDARTDIWAFGVVLFELLTRTLPFRGDHPAALLYAIGNEDPQDLQRLRADLPGSLVSLCKRCLSKDPARRPQSMDEVLSLLGHWPFAATGGTTTSWRRIRGRYVAAGVGALVILTGFLVLYLVGPTPPLDTAGARMRVAVLPFAVTPADTSVADWPRLLQRLLSADLTGVREIGVLDPFSLAERLPGTSEVVLSGNGSGVLKAAKNAEVRLLVSGTILRGAGGQTIRVILLDVPRGETVFSCQASGRGEEDLPLASADIAGQITDFLDVRFFSTRSGSDVRSWLRRRPHSIAAIKAFLQAAQLTYTGSPGVERMLRRAIDLDSTFVPPRIWLIPGLVLRGELAEAHTHQHMLHALEADASPFEQAMIGWADTFLQNDLTGQERQLELALEYSPDDYILLFNLARTRYLMENYRGAIDALSPAISARWEYAPAYYLFAASHHALGEDRQAREILESASTGKTRYPETYALLASVTRRQGDSVAAREAETEFARLQVDAGMAEHAALATLGKFYLSDDMPWEAVNKYTAALALAPERSEYVEALGNARLMCGDTSGAILLYRRILDQDSARSDRSALRQRLLTLTRSTTPHTNH